MSPLTLYLVFFLLYCFLFSFLFAPRGPTSWHSTQWTMHTARTTPSILCILNVLVDATYHHGEIETADQSSGLVDLQQRKGRRRAAYSDRQVGADMPNHPKHPHASLVTTQGVIDTNHKNPMTSPRALSSSRGVQRGLNEIPDVATQAHRGPLSAGSDRVNTS